MLANGTCIFRLAHCKHPNFKKEEIQPSHTICCKFFVVLAAMGGAAAWAGWAMAYPKFWLGGPQCIWPHQ